MTTTNETLILRYDPVAVTLHWIIAISILLLIPMGLTMEDYPVNLKFPVYIIHKSLGIVVLAASLFRLVWRLLNPPPALPAHMGKVEKLLAHAAHWVLYGLMIAMPLTGWLMVSASRKYPTIFFWLTEVPFIPLPETMQNKPQAHEFHNYHLWLAYGAIVLIVAHVGAALKHHFVNKDHVLKRMLPRFVQRKNHA